MKIVFFSLLILVCVQTQAQTSQGFTFQARITAPNGSLLNESGVEVGIKILAPNGCVLWDEIHSSVTVRGGYVNLVIGEGTRASQQPVGMTLMKMADNRPIPKLGLVCLKPDGTLNSGLSFYTPSGSGDVRKVRLSVTLASSEHITADFNLRTVPFALNAATFEGRELKEFLLTNSSSGFTQENMEAFVQALISSPDSSVRWNGAGFVPYNATTGDHLLNSSMPWGKLKDIPSPLAGIGSLSCSDGQILKMTSVGWGCAAQGSGAHTHDAGDINSGVLSVSRGGTGGGDGSIHGAGALEFSAGGLDKDISLVPSGAGKVLLKGPVAHSREFTGGSAGGVPSARFTNLMYDEDGSTKIYGNMTGFFTRNAVGARLDPISETEQVAPWNGVLNQAVGVHAEVDMTGPGGGRVDNAHGIISSVGNNMQGTSVIGKASGFSTAVTSGGTGRIREAMGVHIFSVNATGTDPGNAHRAYGLRIEDGIAASGGDTNKSFSVYSASREPSIFMGRVAVGTEDPPLNALSVIKTGANSQVQFGVATDGGGYLTSTLGHQAHLTGGAEMTVGSKWTARASSSSAIALGYGNVSFTTNGSLTKGAEFTPTTRFFINNAGDVGVGTTSPTSRFDVKALDLEQASGSSVLMQKIYSSHAATGTPHVSGFTFLQERTAVNSPAGWGNHLLKLQSQTDDSFLAWLGFGAVDSVNSAYTAFGRSSSEWMRIDGSGNVGIGTKTPGARLDVQGGDVKVSGAVYSAGMQLTSDARYKRRIEPLDDALERLLRIHGVSYDWRVEAYPEKGFSPRRQVGVIAQEVDAQFPELVEKNDHGFLSVNYAALVAPVIESVRTIYHRLLGAEKLQAAQAREIADLKAENAGLKARIERIEKSLRLQ